MRIQAQAETYAWLIYATPQFDWRQQQHYYNGDERPVPPEDEHYIDHWKAPLENGHQLEVLGMPNSPVRVNDKPAGYAAYVNQPTSNSYVHPPSDGPTHHWPSREHAMEAAEAAYQQKFPIGSDTGPHDSGVDYSDLNSFKL
jgi:hypothetical protein